MTGKKDNGFGTVYRDVLRNPNLTLESKAIYSLLASYAGNRDSAYPTVKTICADLNVSKSRFYKHLDLLISAGIVKKEPRLKNGLKVGVIYKILDSRNSANQGNPQIEYATDGNKTAFHGIPQIEYTEYKQEENKHMNTNNPDTGGSSFEYDKQSPSTVKLW